MYGGTCKTYTQEIGIHKLVGASHTRDSRQLRPLAKVQYEENRRSRTDS